MRQPPAQVLATWPVPNYTDPDTRGNAVLIVSIICVSLAVIVTGLRIYTRLRITCTAGLDDVLIIFGLIFGIAMAAVISLAAEQYGWNRHIWDVPLEWLPINSKLNMVFQILFSLSASFTKISLLWFCKRLLGAGSKGLYSTYNLALMVAMFFVGITCVIFVCLSIFQCRPIHAYWDVELTYPYYCMDAGAIVFAASIVNILTDLVVTLLPMPLIWNLKLPTRQRIVVMSIFSLGIVVNVAGSIRTVYAWKSMIASWDTTWVGWIVLLAATVEINIGLICASAPALRPLIAFFLPRLLGSSNQSGDNTDRRNRSLKLRSSTTASKPSRIGTRGYGLHGETTPTDRLEVFRTVEMKTYTERRTSQETIGNVYDISTNQPLSPRQIEESRLNDDTRMFYTSFSDEVSVESLPSEAKGPSVGANESV